MNVFFDPNVPPDSESRSLGAQRIRSLTQSILRLLGFSGASAVTLSSNPFTVDAATGLAAVVGDPTQPLGIATKQYADNVGTSSLNAAKTYTDTKVASLPAPPQAIAWRKIAPFNSANVTLTGVASPIVLMQLSQAVPAAITNGILLCAAEVLITTGSATSNELHVAVNVLGSDYELASHPANSSDQSPFMYVARTAFPVAQVSANQAITAQLKARGESGMVVVEYGLDLLVIPGQLNIVP